MITTSEDYKRIVAGNDFEVTWSFTVGGASIPLSRVQPFPTITAALFTDKFSLGNVSSSCFEMVFLPTSNPAKHAKVEAYISVNEGDYSVPDVKIGTWFINTRSSMPNGWLKITCYDLIARLDKYTVKKVIKRNNLSTTYPLSAKAAFDIAELASYLSGNTVSADGISFLGGYGNTSAEITGMKAREAAQWAALRNGINVIVDITNQKFKKQKVYDSLYDSFYLEYHDNDYGGEMLITPDGEPMLFHDWENDLQTLRSGSANQIDILGTYAEITGVHLTGKDEDSQEWTVGTSAGTVLEVQYPFDSAAEGIATNILEEVGGFQYTGWKATSALIDPTLQIGDPVSVDGTLCIIAEINGTLAGRYVADCGAAADYEIVGEF